MLTGFKAFNAGVPAQVIRGQVDFARQRQRSEYLLQKLKEAERVLEILRPIGPVLRKLDEDTAKKWMALMTEREKDGPMVQETEEPSLVTSPNDFFSQRFPNQTKLYGPMFFGSQKFNDGRSIFVPDSINDLAFAAILGGDHRLGQQVVWYAQEETFYYRDFRVDAFCPTGEDKLRLLASNWIIRCSEACNATSAKGVLKLRTPKIMDGVITTAKAMLMADAQFFSGKYGRRRYVGNKYIEPNEEPLYRVFVKEGIVQAPGAKLVEQDAFHRFYEFSRAHGAPALKRADFRSLVAEVIREEFNLGLRHDVLGDDGRQHKGWVGITYSPDFSESFSRN